MRFFTMAAVLALAAAPAAAQEEPEGTQAESIGDLPHADFGEGGGVRVTEGTVLHPSFEIASGYQSNVFYQDADDGPDGPMSSAVARFSAGATFGTIDAARAEAEAPGGGSAGPRLLFDMKALLTWVQYISGEDAITEQSDLGIGLNAHVTINPTGKLTFDIRDAFTRSVTPGQSLREDADRDRNDLSARLTYRPGGGAIEAYLGYTFIIDLFEEDVLLFDNRMAHAGSAGIGWRWLPRTLISVDASLATVSPSDTTVKSSSMPLRVTAGVSSLVTPVFGVIARGGYGNGFYASGANVSTYLATAELRLAIGPRLRTAVGYSHDFADSLVSNYFIDHTFYARVAWQALDRVQLRATGDIRLRGYGGITDTPELDFCGDATCGNFRDDVLGRIEVGAEIQLTSWLYGGVSYWLESDATDFFVRSVTGVDSGAYTAQELSARVAARF